MILLKILQRTERNRGEENRIGIINWQKSYSPRSDNKGAAAKTECNT